MKALTVTLFTLLSLSLSAQKIVSSETNQFTEITTTQTSWSFLYRTPFKYLGFKLYKIEEDFQLRMSVSVQHNSRTFIVTEENPLYLLSDEGSKIILYPKKETKEVVLAGDEKIYSIYYVIKEEDIPFLSSKTIAAVRQENSEVAFEWDDFKEKKQGAIINLFKLF